MSPCTSRWFFFFVIVVVCPVRIDMHWRRTRACWNRTLLRIRFHPWFTKTSNFLTMVGLPKRKTIEVNQRNSILRRRELYSVFSKEYYPIFRSVSSVFTTRRIVSSSRNSLSKMLNNVTAAPLYYQQLEQTFNLSPLLHDIEKLCNIRVQ